MSDPDIRINDLIRPAPRWPAGSFAMVADMARAGLTREGNTKLTITLLCIRGERAGQFYMWDLVLDPNNPDYFLSRLHTLGVSSEFMESNPSLSEICTAIISSRLYRVTFTDSERNGRPTTKLSHLELF